MQSSNQESAFWCHICKKEFRVAEFHQSVMKCPYCNSEFCELIEDINNDPRKFVPFGQQQQQRGQVIRQISSQHPQTIISITSIRNTRPIERTIFDNLLTTLFPNSQFSQGNNLEQLISYISQNDPNRYGSPPASKNSVEALKMILEPKENCSVCQEEYQKGQNGVVMPCNHHFHKDCLIPWLQMHNSCPVCRFELPTDDEDYENRKNQKQNA